MTALDNEFALTPEDRARLDAAPKSFARTDADGWRSFAGHVHDQVLAGYAAGEMDLRRALEVMRSCSLGCRLNDRIALMALLVEHALQITPADRKRPPNPEWVQKSAATLVSMLREDQPDEPVAPTEHNAYTTPILQEAISWLVALGICDRIDTRTLYKWYREHRAA
jgi:hypothetical protein